MKSKRSFGALLALFLGATLLPGAVSGQSQLDTSQARAFLGNWTISMQTDMGPFSFGLAIADQGGKVAATMNSPELGGSQNITTISRSDQSLVLEFMANAQGQQFPVSVSLEPNGEQLSVYFDVASGMFTATGTGTRSAS
jgi:hypothetical protein